MASDLSKLTAVTLQVTAADGKRYSLSPLTLNDFGELDVWLAEYVVAKTVRIYRESPASVGEDAVKAAYKIAETVSFASGTGAVLLDTPDGVKQLLWLSLRVKHPNITIEDVGKLVTADTLADLKRRLDEVNFPPADPTKWRQVQRKLQTRVALFGVRWLKRLLLKNAS